MFLFFDYNYKVDVKIITQRTPDKDFKMYNLSFSFQWKRDYDL